MKLTARRRKPSFDTPAPPRPVEHQTPWHTLHTCTAPFTGGGAILEAERHGVRAWVLFLPVDVPPSTFDVLHEERPVIVTHLPRVALAGDKMIVPRTVACLLRVKGTATLILRDRDPEVMLALAALIDGDRAVALFAEYEQRDTFITIEDRPTVTTRRAAPCIFGGKL
jgi:hypothetical protein